MTNEIILTKLDDEADRIIEAFAERAGLHSDDEGDRVHFDVSHDHELDVIQTLSEVDEDWPEHVGVADPEG